jgi:prepilin-type N-terminal cleavage/methylation domain-containing protein
MKIRFQIKQLPKQLGSERGTTLVELLVAMAISALVFGIITTIFVQFMLVTRWGNSQLKISSDFQLASIWLGRDALEAASFTPGTGTEYGTLSWADSSQQFRYSYNPTDQTLIREHFDTGVLQSTNTVARYIANQSDVVFSLSGKLLTVAITSTSGQEVENVDLQFALRTR